MPAWLSAIIAFLAGLVELALRIVPSSDEQAGEAKNEQAHAAQAAVTQAKVDDVPAPGPTQLDSDLGNGVF